MSMSTERWELEAAEAVGSVIEAWGFKRNEGRVWALTYLRGRPLSAADLQEALGLSKGAVSMVLASLERWGVVERAREPGESVWTYRARTDFLSMIRRVLVERELAVVRRAAEALRTAHAAAAAANVPREAQVRLGRMHKLAQLTERALNAFLKTTRFDLGGVHEVLSVARGLLRT
jgi:HTH-type transcriptional regulator, glycine betaine synthesis regulator